MPPFCETHGMYHTRNRDDRWTCFLCDVKEAEAKKIAAGAPYPNCSAPLRCGLKGYCRADISCGN